MDIDRELRAFQEAAGGVGGDGGVNGGGAVQDGVGGAGEEVERVHQQLRLSL
jgi:hypothetical protein